jgi:hypothetical protein
MCHPERRSAIRLSNRAPQSKDPYRNQGEKVWEEKSESVAKTPQNRKISKFLSSPQKASISPNPNIPKKI